MNDGRWRLRNHDHMTIRRQRRVAIERAAAQREADARCPRALIAQIRALGDHDCEDPRALVERLYRDGVQAPEQVAALIASLPPLEEYVRALALADQYRRERGLPERSAQAKVDIATRWREEARTPEEMLSSVTADDAMAVLFRRHVPPPPKAMRPKRGRL